MKRLVVLLSVAALLPALAAAEPVERVLTLDESVTTALHNSQELLVLREQIGMAQQRISEARAQIFPKIDFNLNASRFENDFPTVLPPSFSSIYLPQAKKDLYYSTRFSLWQYLYAGGRYTTNLRLAEVNLSQAQSRSDAARNRTVLDTRKAFYQCLLLRKKIAVYDAAIKAAEPRTRAGNADQAGRLRDYRREVAVLRHEYNRELLRFLSVTGLELNTMIDVQGTLARPEERYELNKCLAWAVQFRPEMRQTQFQETMDSLQVNLSVTERYPTVTLGANYELAGDRVFSTDKSWNATVNVNVPIFDGWASWARIRQSRNTAREATIRRTQIEDRVRFEVREAFMDYEFWYDQAAHLPAPAGQADTERALKDRLEALDTVYQALVSRASLEWAIGKQLNDQ